MPQSTQKFIAANIPEETHNALIEVSSLQGRHPSDVVAEYIERGILEDKDFKFEGSMPAPLRVFEMWSGIRAKQVIVSQLRQIAQYLISTADEKKMDEFSSVCEENGLSPAEIMREAQDNAQMLGSTILLSESSSIEHAKQFLIRLLGDGKDVSASDVENKADELDISLPTLRAAKKAIGIESVRMSNCWVWRMPQSLRMPPMVNVKGASK